MRKIEPISQEDEEAEGTKADCCTKFKTYLVLGTVCMSFSVWGLIISLQPAFYPEEAEKKGATPAEVNTKNILMCFYFPVYNFGFKF